MSNTKQLNECRQKMRVPIDKWGCGHCVGASPCRPWNRCSICHVIRVPCVVICVGAAHMHCHVIVVVCVGDFPACLRRRHLHGGALTARRRHRPCVAFTARRCCCPRVTLAAHRCRRRLHVALATHRHLCDGLAVHACRRHRCLCVALAARQRCHQHSRRGQHPARRKVD